jgi:hypothetical protein
MKMKKIKNIFGIEVIKGFKDQFWYCGK